MAIVFCFASVDVDDNVTAAFVLVAGVTDALLGTVVIVVAGVVVIVLPLVVVDFNVCATDEIRFVILVVVCCVEWLVLLVVFMDGPVAATTTVTPVRVVFGATDVRRVTFDAVAVEAMAADCD